MTDESTRPDTAAAPGYDAEAALAVAEQELTALRADLDAARKEAAEATLRAQAELQNVRKRLERDADNTRKYVLEKLQSGDEDEWARSSVSTSAPPTPAWRSWKAASPRSSRTRRRTHHALRRRLHR
jgi:uncharacterized membrane protein YccC